MKKMITLVSLVLVAIFSDAQSVSYDSLDLGNFVAPVRSDGQLFQNSTYTLGGLEWPKAASPQDKRYVSYSSNLWMGGHDGGGVLHIAAETYQQSGQGFHPGLVAFDDTAWDSVWKLTRAEVDQFRADFANSTVNFANYPGIATWPAFGLDVNNVRRACAPFVDMDNDPLNYTPTAGDYPDIPGDQAIYFQFTDSTAFQPSPFPNRFSIEVRAFAYVYDCPELEDVLFLKYAITNPTSRTYSDYRLGLWQDFDLGNYADDYIGTDTVREMFFAYNGDAFDETAKGYGLNPPAAGMMCLSHAAYGGMYYENDFTQYGNPQTPNDYYNYLRSYWKNGQPLSQGGGPAQPFAYPGNAGWCGGLGEGWSEVGEGNQPYDRRGLLTVEPMQFLPNETKTFTFAVLMARGLYNDNLGSVCELQSYADTVRNQWNSGQPCQIASGMVPPVKGLQVEMYPNPAHTSVSLQFENPRGVAAHLQVLDIAGREVIAPISTHGERLNLDVQDWATGIYWLRLECGGKTFTGKLLRMED